MKTRSLLTCLVVPLMNFVVIVQSTKPCWIDNAPYGFTHTISCPSGQRLVPLQSRGNAQIFRKYASAIGFQSVSVNIVDFQPCLIPAECFKGYFMCTRKSVDFLPLCPKKDTTNEININNKGCGFVQSCNGGLIDQSACQQTGCSINLRNGQHVSIYTYSFHATNDETRLFVASGQGDNGFNIVENGKTFHNMQSMLIWLPPMSSAGRQVDFLIGYQVSDNSADHNTFNHSKCWIDQDNIQDDQTFGLPQCSHNIKAAQPQGTTASFTGNGNINVQRATGVNIKDTGAIIGVVISISFVILSVVSLVIYMVAKRKSLQEKSSPSGELNGRSPEVEHHSYANTIEPSIGEDLGVLPRYETQASLSGSLIGSENRSVHSDLTQIGNGKVSSEKSVSFVPDKTEHNDASSRISRDSNYSQPSYRSSQSNNIEDDGPYSTIDMNRS